MNELEKARLQLKTLIAVDIDPAAIAAMIVEFQLAAKTSDLLKFDRKHFEYLCGPITRRKVDLPVWLTKTVYLSRVDQVFKEYSLNIVGSIATPAEILADFYGANQTERTKPSLDRDWQKLYVWCFKETVAQFNLPIKNLTTVSRSDILADYSFFGREIRAFIVKAGLRSLGADLFQIDKAELKVRKRRA